MRPTVIVAYGFPDAEVEREVLSSVDAEVVQIESLSSPQARTLLRDADALMVTLQPVPAAIIAHMERCRIISRVGTGTDTVDLEAASERRIWVTNVPDYAVDEVSTHALALLLSHARQLPRTLELTTRGVWDPGQVPPIRRLSGQTLGLLGFGRIGRAVGAKARSLGLEVVVYDPYIDARSIEGGGMRAVDLPTLLRSADYVSLHAPLTDDTRNIIDREALEMMKPNAFLINTARGGFIDLDALLASVRAGRIAGAALDVLPDEPPPSDHPLFREERVILTPHVAWYSEEARREMRVRGAEEVVRVLRGEAPRSPVNRVDHPRKQPVC
jgi:D-3-phosphoglycerate dehydrogenase